VFLFFGREKKEQATTIEVLDLPRTQIGEIHRFYNFSSVVLGCFPGNNRSNSDHRRRQPAEPRFLSISESTPFWTQLTAQTKRKSIEDGLPRSE
jgi:hypothetical protein